jgi:hypothetical protein
MVLLCQVFINLLKAWYQKPVGKFNITAGKFYVPFELQEWQYETKWGVMLQNSQGPYDFSGSLNYNFNVDEPNAYFRVARRFGTTATVGLSLGAGRGLSFDSTHNKALGLDATLNYRGFQLISSYMGLRSGSSSDDFNFGLPSSLTGSGGLHHLSPATDGSTTPATWTASAAQLWA